MMACTVRQPFAAALIYGSPPPKPLENRSQDLFGSVRPGDWVAIHSARALYEMDEKSWQWFRSAWPEAPRSEEDYRMRKGVVLGARRYIGTVTDQTLRSAVVKFPNELRAARDWFGGPFAACFDHVVVLPQVVECRGQLGLWRLPEEIEALVQVEIRKLGRLPPPVPLPMWGE